MGTIHALPLGGTVRLRRTPVNRLVTMDAGSGDRLRALIESRWPRKRTGARGGGIRALCRAMGVSPETAYGWFRGDNDPSLGALASMAELLGVSRWEIVAAMDGEAAIPATEAGEERLERVLDRMLAERGFPPRRDGRGSAA